MTESLTFELNFNILLLKFDKFILFWLTVHARRATGKPNICRYIQLRKNVIGRPHILLYKLP